MKMLLITTLTVGTITSLVGCSKVEGRAEAPARPVKVAPVQPQTTQGRIRYSVSVQPYEQVTVAFKAGGYIDSVLRRRDADGRLRTLQPGDVVSAGTVVARVRTADYRERVNQAESSLREIEASVVKARLDLDRAETLFASASLTKPDLDAAKAAYDAAMARTDSGRAQVELARIALADCELTAPINGVVLERRIEDGMLVGSGSVGFVLGRVADVKAVFGVPDSLVQRMNPGQPITMTTEAHPGSMFSGRVTAVAPSADPQSRVFNIEITIPNGDGRLRPGMIGTIEVPTDNASAAGAGSGSAVPLAAVVRSNTSPEGYSVFVVDAANGQTVARARSVVLGPASGNDISVMSGVSLGERVIVMGASLVNNGDPVRVIP